MQVLVGYGFGDISGCFDPCVLESLQQIMLQEAIAIVMAPTDPSRYDV